MKLFLRLLAVVLIISSCGSTRKSTRSVTLPEISVKASDNDYRATAQRDWDILHTDVSISFNFAERTAKGNATLKLKPYFYSSDKIVLDAKSMKINQVTSNGKNLKVNYLDDSLIIYLSRKYHRTESLEINIDYIAMPYAQPTGGSKAITEDRGLYFINTDKSVPNKPVQIWTQGETESNSHWMPTIDKPNERFSVTLHITVPDTMTTLGNGKLAKQVASERGMRTDTWAMDKDIQPYIVMMAVGEYDIIEDESWSGIPVNYYVEHKYAPYAKDMFRNTTEMIGFFSGVTGVPYPWNKYSQVVVRDYVSGAMENTTATLFGEFMNQTSREMMDLDYENVVSHELFHQWFGDYVTAESWSNLTLNESFATYGEQLWRLYKYGKASQQKLGYEDLMSYIRSVKNGGDASLVRFHYNSREDLFDRISYQKGGAILYYLHGLIGDTAFYNSMRQYLTTNALQPAEAHNWRMAVEQVTGKDWNWFFNQWYYKGGHPVLDVKYKFDDKTAKVTLTIEQKQDVVYQLPLAIKVVSGERSLSDIVDIDKRTVDITYPYNGNERPAIFFDANHWLVGEINDHKTNEQWLRYYKSSGKEEYTDKILALNATKDVLANTTVQDIYKLAINDHLEYIRSNALANLQNEKNAGVRKSFKTDILFLATKDPSNHVRAAANRVIGAWEIKEAETDLYETLNDTSFMVAAAALEALSQIDKDTAYILAKEIAKTQPGGFLSWQVWKVIGEQANTEDSSYFIEQQYTVSGKNKMSFSAALGAYLKNTPSDNAFESVLHLLEYMMQAEPIGIYRSNIASYIYEAGYFYKGEAEESNKKKVAAKVQTRLNMLRNAMLRIEEKESDEDNRKNFSTYRQEIFGKNN